MRSITCLIIGIVMSTSYCQQQALPEGFVYIKELIPDIAMEIRYASANNFVGRVIKGYRAPKAILSVEATRALRNVQKEVKKKGYHLKIFDSYRPQRAVNYFIQWAAKKEDTLTKQEYYPEVAKKNLFKYGYLATRSGHSRGSTVDLTLIDTISKKEVDMGGSYDFFGDISHHNTNLISKEQKRNRELLRSVMQKYGFVAYAKEWWHYTYRPEPYPDTYFDFVVE